MIRKTPSNLSNEGSSRGLLSSIGLGFGRRNSTTTNNNNNGNASANVNSNSNDGVAAQQGGGDDDGLGDSPLKSQDFAFYFKSSGQVLKKLENSK